jgi:hypothetical protein
MMVGDCVAAVFGNNHGVFLMQYLASYGLSSQLSPDINTTRGFRGMSLLRAGSSEDDVGESVACCLRHTALTRRSDYELT